MKIIKLLDGTLRDGGYVNDWRFGKYGILNTISSLEEAGIDIIELGFIRNDQYDENRTVFSSIEQISDLITEKKKNIEYVAMAEATNPISMEYITPKTEHTVDSIRVIVWKDKHDDNGNVVDALQDGYKYCKEFIDKGYDLYVQPARVEQYSDEEFVEMLKLFSDLKPKAVYIVDSWGTMYSDDVLHYLGLADKNLDLSVRLGFHGHNNLMQAFSNAVEFINYNSDRELILDSSVYGIGRGAGNLNTELIAKYLNEKKGKGYRIQPLLDIYDDLINHIRTEHAWGYTAPFFLSALHHANPQYGNFFGEKHEISSRDVNDIMSSFSDVEKLMFSKKTAEEYCNKVL